MFLPHFAKCTSRSKSRASPRIQFLGLLDTVKRTRDNSLHDISFLGSVKNLRHAVALNETRSHFRPELYPSINEQESLTDRSMIQAWFVGAHADIGGGAMLDGLSLYPLQWLLIESQRYNLVLDHNPGPRFANLIEDPIKLVLPSQSFSHHAGSQSHANQRPWIFSYANGIQIEMWDIRLSHNHGNLQDLGRKKLEKRSLSLDGSKRQRSSLAFWGWRKKKTKSMLSATPENGAEGQPISDADKPKGPKPGQSNMKDYTRHIIRLNPGFPHYTFQEVRKPFKNGKLQGYCEHSK